MFFLRTDLIRRNACSAVMQAPDGYVVEIKPETRNLEMNKKLWAMLTDVSGQVDWYGRRYKPEDWKHILTAGLKGYETAPGINGEMVVLGKSTSKMNKREFSDLVELIYAFGAERNVVWSEKALDVFEEHINA
ncbi:MAG: recombination protein NinB [Thiomicrospira sp.]|nr:MAG: recombination protein NinB [Thiomicrospira sp.]